MRHFLVCVFLILPFFSLYGEDDLDERAKVYRQEGYRRQSMGDIQNAFNYYQKAIHVEPLYVEVYNDLGVLYEAMGDDDNVVKMYTKALDIDPQYLPAYTNLAFFHEKKGDFEKASYYWQKRYELGEEGQYWWEVAKQHLDQLELYPPLVRLRQDKAARELEEQLVYRREQTRLKIVEEARLRFKAGSSLFLKGDYTAAIKEFQIAKFLNPPDEELKAKTDEFIEKAEDMLEKKRALNYTKEALDYIENDDFLSAGEKLKDAFSVVSDISQKL
ncbi:MAG: tetratricopeptide repeat protein [Candidatus Omnitrophota bacterium]|nr:MAG: tetratricopeptide repeat protein [Candidatus Omnitrophota bacterium]